MKPSLTQHRLVVSVLSPVHIGCGEGYPFTHYLVHDDVLVEVDPTQALWSQEQRNELLRLVNLPSREQPLLSLQRFYRRPENQQCLLTTARKLVGMAPGFARQYSDRMGKVANHETDSKVINQLDIERTSYQSHSSQAYLPGSSLKGALRTAWLAALNQDRPLDYALKKEKNPTNKLAKTLFKGSFATDPLRLFKLADSQPLKPMPTKVMFGLNHKKKRVIKEGNEVSARGPVQRLECLTPGYRIAELSLTLNPLNDIEPGHEDVPQLRPDIHQLAKHCNRHFLPVLDDEFKVFNERQLVDAPWQRQMEKLRDGEWRQAFEQGQAFLLRVGRHSGAEANTLNGVRHIKIMQGKGQPAIYQNSPVTLWLAGNSDQDKNNMLPFGWLLVEIDPKQPLLQTQQWLATYEQQAQNQQAQLQSWQQAHQQQRQQQQQQAIEQAQKQAAAEAEAAREAAQLAALSPNQRKIRDARSWIAEKGQLPNTGCSLFQEKIWPLLTEADTNSSWSADDKKALAETLSVKHLERKFTSLGKKEKDIKALLRRLRGEA